MRDEKFEQLYAEHAQGLLSFLAYRTGDRALAEDVMADTFERVLTARRRFDPRRGSAKTWVYSIALNLLRDHVRRSAAEQRAVERTGAAASSPDEIGRADDREAVMGALVHLSNEERETVALRYGADLTVPEIARVTGERLTTVEGRLYRGLRKLRGVLDG
jgi:RNA polymerase sigma factor (sigma-70 family)